MYTHIRIYSLNLDDLLRCLRYSYSTCKLFFSFFEMQMNFTYRKEKNKIYKGHNPIEFTFMQWSQKGIIGNFRKQIKIPVKISKNGKVKEFQRNAWVITVSNKVSVTSVVELVKRDTLYF